MEWNWEKRGGPLDLYDPIIIRKRLSAKKYWTVGIAKPSWVFYNKISLSPKKLFRWPEAGGKPAFEAAVVNVF